MELDKARVGADSDDALTPGGAALLGAGRYAWLFVSTVFVATSVQVLVVPFTVLGGALANWTLPFPPSITFATLLVGCAVQALALLLLERRPRFALSGTVVIYLALSVALGVPTWLQGSQIVVALALFVFGAKTPLVETTAWLVGAIGISSLTLTVWLLAVGTEPKFAIGFVLAEAASFATLWAAAAALGVWRSVQLRDVWIAEEQAAHLQRDYARRLREAQEVERTRIAQDLHDVAGQHLAGLVMLTDAALRLAPNRPSEALRLVEEVRSEGRFAAASVTGALADLRATGAVPRELTPGLQRSVDLVGYWRQRGMDITLETVGDLDDLPIVISTVGYRVLQEGLTNAAKHAFGSPVAVHIGVTRVALHLRVENGPARFSLETPSVGLGWGLHAIRERVALLRGTIVAQETADAGWSLSVALPTGVTGNGEEVW